MTSRVTGAAKAAALLVVLLHAAQEPEGPETSTQEGETES